jgi:hypothetical protein
MEISMEVPQKLTISWVQCLIPIILTTWEAKIRKSVVRAQLRQKVCKTISQPIKS